MSSILLDYVSLKLEQETNIHKSSSCPPAVAVGQDSHYKLINIQSHLNKWGASELIVKIVTKSPSTPVFIEAMLLAQALLYGGNTAVQVNAIYPCIIVPELPLELPLLLVFSLIDVQTVAVWLSQQVI